MKRYSRIKYRKNTVMYFVCLIMLIMTSIKTYNNTVKVGSANVEQPWADDHYEEINRLQTAFEAIESVDKHDGQVDYGSRHNFNSDAKEFVKDAFKDTPELYMVTISGETSGLSPETMRNNDSGNAYGIFSLDYRYELVAGMNYLYTLNPELWNGFKEYLSYKDGNSALRNNREIRDTFNNALKEDYQQALRDQLSYMYEVHYSVVKDALEESGLNLASHDVAVSAAILSVSVNCGASARKELVKYLDADMTDSELIDTIYWVRNNVLSQYHVGNVKKGTNGRFKHSEKEMVLDLLSGSISASSENLDYGNGVEWPENIFEYTEDNFL